ncbi:MAG: beta-lactamase family protein [Verrucomicrobia bacterium]|nr:beta-lactamase family protein [Verrucomicrobiota bacterium]
MPSRRRTLLTRRQLTRALTGLMLALLVTLLSPASGRAQTNYDFAAVTGLLQSNLNLYGTNVLMLLYQRDAPVYSFQAGTLATNSRRGIASASKLLSGTIVLALAERGYFQLDDPIKLYLPSFTNFVSNGYNKGDITIRQCFAMTSGLYGASNANYDTDATLTLAQSVDLIATNIPVVFVPGTQLAYDGNGMQVVGRICEIVTGTDWRTLATNVLFQPLGMTNSDYNFFGLNNPAIAGGARSSVEDYQRFLRMVLNNGALPDGRAFLSSRAVQVFFTNQTFGLPEYYSPWPVSTNFAYNQRPDYDMGSWALAQNPTNGVVEEVSSPGAFGTWPWVDRRRNLRGVIFMFGANGFSTTVYNNLRILNAVRAAVDAVPVTPPPPANALNVSRTGDYVKLDWAGGAQFETSSDLQSWSTLSWVTSPFFEFLPAMTTNRFFYRLLAP